MRPLTPRALCLFVLLVSAPAAFAFDPSGTLTIRPQMPDIVPGDGILDGGTYANPFVVQDQSGTTQYEIRSQVPDIVPNDGVLDQGSWANPFVAEPVE